MKFAHKYGFFDVLLVLNKMSQNSSPQKRSEVVSKPNSKCTTLQCKDLAIGKNDFFAEPLLILCKLIWKKCTAQLSGSELLGLE